MKETISIDGYEFEKPDFECGFYDVVEVYKDKFMIFGKVKNGVGQWITMEWQLDSHILGKAIVADFNLTPIKKKWHEDESNFPCVMYDERYKGFFVCEGRDIQLHTLDRFRPATKEEILSLLVKED